MSCRFNSSSSAWIFDLTPGINTLCTAVFVSLLFCSRKEICDLAAKVCSVIHDIFTSKEIRLILISTLNWIHFALWEDLFNVLQAIVWHFGKYTCIRGLQPVLHHCSVLRTVAVIFVGVVVIKCSSTRTKAWLLKVMVAYTAWIFLFVIWVFVFSTHRNAILGRSKIGEWLVV